MEELKNKTIIITGGSMGIGLAVAEKCAEAGAQLILLARQEKDLKESLCKISKITKLNHKYFSLDVGNEDEVKKIFQVLESEYSSIDGLVNCAGIYGPIGKIDEVSTLEFVKAIQTNLIGTFFMCHYMMPLIKKSTRGKIINFAGGGAASPFPNYSAYATSKIGVVRLTENMAYEFMNDNIDINSIAPGFVVTRLHQDTIKAGEKAGTVFLSKTLNEINKGGVSLDIPARLAVFLLSEKSDGITGKFISAPWDPWENENFLNKLKNNNDFATLRRIDEKDFYKKGNI